MKLLLKLKRAFKRFLLKWRIKTGRQLSVEQELDMLSLPNALRLLKRRMKKFRLSNEAQLKIFDLKNSFGKGGAGRAG